MSISLSANGNYNLQGVTGATGDAGSRWRGGIGSFELVVATPDSATVKLQAKFTTGWADIGDEVTFTGSKIGNFQQPPVQLRLNVSGGTGTHASEADVIPVP